MKSWNATTKDILQTRNIGLVRHEYIGRGDKNSEDLVLLYNESCVQNDSSVIVKVQKINDCCFKIASECIFFSSIRWPFNRNSILLF